jgi:hypothetical protein
VHDSFGALYIFKIIESSIKASYDLTGMTSPGKKIRASSNNADSPSLTVNPRPSTLNASFEKIRWQRDKMPSKSKRMRWQVDKMPLKGKRIRSQNGKMDRKEARSTYRY